MHPRKAYMVASLTFAGMLVTAGTLTRDIPGLVMLVLAAACGLFAWQQAHPADAFQILPAESLSVQHSSNPSKLAAALRTCVAPFLRHNRLTLAVLIVLHLAVILPYNHHRSSADIDTYTFQRDAASTLVDGRNPYGGTQANVYNAAQTSEFYSPQVVAGDRVLVGLQYPPLTLLWVLPGYLLGDVRLSYIAAILLTAIFTFALAPRGAGLYFATFLLVNPLTFKVENRCWTEPLTLLVLTLTVYTALRHRRWLPVALGLLLASKQYSLLALPFLGCLVAPFQWKACLRLLILALFVAAATLLPFAWPHPYALWHDLVLFHLRQPFRPDALSFAVPFPVMQKIGPLLLLAFLAWTLLRLIHQPAFFAVAYGLALLLFFATSKQAFDNYFFLIAQAFLLAVPALLTPNHPREIINPC